MIMQIETFFHRSTGTLTHLLICKSTQSCAIIDPCYDFDLFSGTLSTEFAEKILNFITEKDLKCEWVLETHAHADHLTAAQWFKQKLGCKVGIGEGITKVQQHFKQVFNLGEDFATDGSQFDYLFKDGELFHVGDLRVKVIATPGHTNDSISYSVGQAIFVGDTLFAPQRGSARCDFPGGNAEKLYHSIQKIYSCDDSTWLYLCHDYPEEGQQPIIKVTVGEQKIKNCQVNSATSLQDYVKLRQQRDASLSIPKLLYPSLQVNIAAGQLPNLESNQQRYLKLPLFIK
jgi:glyoxylase-like metal-dependent hydrolase (beta-lactamase superfamily II)